MTRARRRLFCMAMVALAVTALHPVRAPLAQTATLSPASALPASVLFAPNISDLPDQARPILDAVVVLMRANEDIRIQLVAYASGSPDRPDQARRISLVRAAYIRTYLMERGVTTTRIDVRGLGNRNDGGSPDRVDIATLDR